MKECYPNGETVASAILTYMGKATMYKVPVNPKNLCQAPYFSFAGVLKLLFVCTSRWESYIIYQKMHKKSTLRVTTAVP